jgi:hypothetical protein
VVKPCCVDGCAKDATSHGMCGMHANRLKRNGHFDLTRRQNGLGNINAAGYVDIRWNGKRTYEHIKVAQMALGKPLPAKAVVHHVDENKSNNAPENLVICPDEAYHRLIHRRMAAMDACGNPNYRKCPVCNTWDDPERLDKGNRHKHCSNEQRKRSYHRSKERS